ncbi:unnamed protein product, partial [Medioppia subpectinata]
MSDQRIERRFALRSTKVFAKRKASVRSVKLSVGVDHTSHNTTDIYGKRIHRLDNRLTQITARTSSFGKNLVSVPKRADLPLPFIGRSRRRFGAEEPAVECRLSTPTVDQNVILLSLFCSLVIALSAICLNRSVPSPKEALMDEEVVAVHMMESSDGTYMTAQVVPEDEFQPNDDNEMIAANDGDEPEDNGDDGEGDEDYEPLKSEDQTAGDEDAANSEADDIIIAEAVVVTHYSCKFCNRRFDSIEKVKNHYLLRHNKDQSIVKRFSGAGGAGGQRTIKTESTADESNGEEEENNDIEDSPQNSPKKRKVKRKGANAGKGKAVHNLRVVSNITAADDALLKKKRGRKPTGVTRKYPCDWPSCNYVARHSVHLKDHKRTHTGEKPYRCNWPDCGHSFVQGSALK